MKVGPLNPTTTFGLDPNAPAKEADAKTKTGQVDGKPAIDPEKLRLAKEFEQIFIRKMLSSLEKSGQNTSGTSSAGGNAYGSMVVSALADAVSKGGGIGLADMIAKAASQNGQLKPSTDAGTTNAIQNAIAQANAASHPTPATIGGPHITVPENVGPSVPASAPVPENPPAATTTYQRPAPAPIVNENNDIHDLFKEPNR